MDFLILIDGRIKGPFPIDKLLEEGITKTTRTCINNGQDNWVRAEDISELDSLWEPMQEKKPDSEPPVEVPKPPPIPTKPELDPIPFGNTPETPTNPHEPKPEVSPKPREFDLKRLLMLGIVASVILAVGLWIYLNRGEGIDNDSSSEENPSIITPSGSVNTDEFPKKTLHPQQDYDRLIDDARNYYSKDSLSQALETFSIAKIIRKKYSLSISKEAKDIYKIAIDKGNQAYDGQLKELMPLALTHYEIAQAIDSTADVAKKIKNCQ